MKVYHETGNRFISTVIFFFFRVIFFSSFKHEIHQMFIDKDITFG